MLGRRQREVYRVYAEDELLHDDEGPERSARESLADELESHPRSSFNARAADRSGGRRLGLTIVATLLGLLVGVVAATLEREGGRRTSPSSPPASSAAAAPLASATGTDPLRADRHTRRRPDRLAPARPGRLRAGTFRENPVPATSSAPTRDEPAPAERAPAAAVTDAPAGAAEPPAQATAPKPAQGGHGETGTEFGFEQ